MMLITIQVSSAVRALHGKKTRETELSWKALVDLKGAKVAMAYAINNRLPMRKNPCLLDDTTVRKIDLPHL